MIISWDLVLLLALFIVIVIFILIRMFTEDADRGMVEKVKIKLKYKKIGRIDSTERESELPILVGQKEVVAWHRNRKR